MNPDHPHFAQWDAAYVLGALSPADRREYEAHLDECADCRRAVGELAPTAGLLSRLTAEDAEQIGHDEPDASPEPVAVLAHARERARRRRRIRWVALVAAAVLVIAAVAVPVTLASMTRPTESFALESTSGIPLEANVRLTSVAWGTRIELDCRYPEASEGEDPDREWTYALAVVASDGEASTVSTWRSSPGAVARLSAGTALDVGDIRSVEVRAMDGRVLMAYDLPQG